MKQDSVEKSYQAHSNQYFEHITDQLMEEHSKTWFETDTVDSWRHYRMYKSLDALIDCCNDENWLTVGDGRYGKDAHYLMQKGLNVLATDICTYLLEKGKESGYIQDFKQENAEKLSFFDNEFDYTLCKESYHHFPRPVIALYEMLRVSSKGVVLIEPNDRMNGHYFEKYNYIYTLSKREVEKLAIGLGLPFVAFKEMNDYYEKGVEYEKQTKDSALFKKVKKNVLFRDILSTLKLLKPGILVTMIFKEIPADKLRNKLASSGYELVYLPTNPNNKK